MAKYGVIVEETWESWTDRFDSLKEARARVRYWEQQPRPSMQPTKVTLVRILSEHEEGSDPAPEPDYIEEQNRTTFAKWSRSVK